MLLEFGVNNYLSFKNTTLLSMVSSANMELPTHRIKIKKTKKSELFANRVGALFGANASGKSNILRAFMAMRKLVLRHGLGISKTLEKSALPHEYFLLDEQSKSNPTSFDILLSLQNTIYRYTISLYEDRFLYEKLSILDSEAKENIVFERKDLNVVFYDKFDTANFKEITKKLIKGKTLLLTILGELKEDPFQDVFNFFKTVRSESDPDDFIPMVYDLTESDSLKYIVKFLQFADTGLYDIVRSENEDVDILPDELRKIVLKLKGTGVSVESKQIELLFKHRALQADKGQYIADFQLFNESRGTIKFIILMFQMLETIKENGVFVVDEIESALHPILVEWLIVFFTSIKNTSAQLLFSSHSAFFYFGVLWE